MINEITLEDLQTAAELNLNTDGYLVPIVFFVTPQETSIANLSEVQGDFIDALKRYVKENPTNKLLILSEAKLYHAPSTMTEQTIQDIIEMQRIHYTFDLEQIYQILEITHDNIRYFTKPFSIEKTNEGKPIVTYGIPILSEKVQILQYSDVQTHLIHIN